MVIKYITVNMCNIALQMTPTELKIIDTYLEGGCDTLMRIAIAIVAEDAFHLRYVDNIAMIITPDYRFPMMCTSPSNRYPVLSDIKVGQIVHKFMLMAISTFRDGLSSVYAGYYDTQLEAVKRLFKQCSFKIYKINGTLVVIELLYREV